ncbi:MAG: hypothetical protein HQM08_11555 [Candidatus Riflebacteria bacterium]|nr:hypothetical protein [Candidatus Riflebacteria bacterium]
MSFVHPIVMVVFFYLLFMQKNAGLKIVSLKPHAPDFKDERKKLLDSHRSMAYLILGIGFVGMIGGALVTTYWLGYQVPFQLTYGHPFFGLLILAALIIGVILGFTIKDVKKPKIKERFLNFHYNIIYVVGAFAILSLLTGLIVLVNGPSPVS